MLNLIYSNKANTEWLNRVQIIEIGKDICTLSLKKYIFPMDIIYKVDNMNIKSPDNQVKGVDK